MTTHILNQIFNIVCFLCQALEFNSIMYGLCGISYGTWHLNVMYTEHYSNLVDIYSAQLVVMEQLNGPVHLVPTRLFTHYYIPSSQERQAMENVANWVYDEAVKNKTIHTFRESFRDREYLYNIEELKRWYLGTWRWGYDQYVNKIVNARHSQFIVNDYTLEIIVGTSIVFGLTILFHPNSPWSVWPY